MSFLFLPRSLGKKGRQNELVRPPPPADGFPKGSLLRFSIVVEVSQASAQGSGLVPKNDVARAVQSWCERLVRKGVAYVDLRVAAVASDSVTDCVPHHIVGSQSIDGVLRTVTSIHAAQLQRRWAAAMARQRPSQPEEATQDTHLQFSTDLDVFAPQEEKGYWADNITSKTIAKASKRAAAAQAQLDDVALKRRRRRIMSNRQRRHRRVR